MSNCWHILQTDPSGATARTVKAAYARMLKLHRPDEDPEGFRRVHEAYQCALAELASEVPTAFPDSDEGTSPATPDPHQINNQAFHATAGPDPLVEALQNISAALDTRIRQKVRVAWQAYDQSVANAGRPKAEAEIRLISDTGAHMGLLAEVVTDAQLIASLAEADGHVAHAVARQWCLHSNDRRMGEFFVSFNRARLTVLDAGAAQALCALACAMAPYLPDNANRLLQKAFPFLPPDERRPIADSVEYEAALGHLVERLPRDDKSFWLAFLHGQPPDCTWRDSTSRQLLITLLQSYGPNWPGFRLLNQKMPASAWSDMARAIQLLLS